MSVLPSSSVSSSSDSFTKTFSSLIVFKEIGTGLFEVIFPHTLRSGYSIGSLNSFSAHGRTEVC